MSGTKWGVTYFVWDELGCDIMSGTNWGVTLCRDELGSDSLGQTWIWWDKGGSYKIDADSRVPCWARGSLEYRVGAEGPLESVEEKL
uniref:Uncharacterized protein n=1 Tax=Meloidogyne enterolobii TaxID=390850 RepID=A0A6V7X272_MELEN|nr:unnamed protein product [Meloidogyne enterolobii]